MCLWSLTSFFLISHLLQIMLSTMQRAYVAGADNGKNVGMTRCRRWVVTAWSDPNGYSCLLPRYSCIGEEVCPETQTVHWQGYLEFEKAMTLSSIKAKIKGVTEHIPGSNVKPSWWAPARGTAEQNLTYCSKDGKVVVKGKLVAKGQRSDLIEIQEKIVAGEKLEEVREQHFRSFMQFPRALKEYAESKAPRRNWVTNVICIWGATGLGKSRLAAWMGGTFCRLDKGGFLHGYAGEEVVVFDEFNPLLCERELFLQMTDRYPMTMNVKGSSVNWVPRTIIFTSNNNPHDWYVSCGGQCPAVTRRVSQWIELTESWEPPFVPIAPAVEEAEAWEPVVLDSLIAAAVVEPIVLSDDSDSDADIDLTVIPATPAFSRQTTQHVDDVNYIDPNLLCPARKRLRHLFEKACARDDVPDAGMLYAKRQRLVVLDSDDDGEDYGVGEAVPKSNPFLDLEAGEGSDSD